MTLHTPEESLRAILIPKDRDTAALGGRFRHAGAPDAQRARTKA